MAVSRHQQVEQQFIREVRALAETPPLHRADPGRLDATTAWRLFESQLTSRLLDLEARAMKARDQGYYTIGSAGHEGNAAVAAALRPTDICFLHYRSGAFMVERSRQVPGVTPIFDTLLSYAASAEDPASGGRHKVWGSLPLNVPPQTSTIASHLPKALGAAFSIARAVALRAGGAGGRLPRPLLDIPDDALAMASFGDASLSHSTALGAVNAALWADHQGLPVPVLFVCEDNGIGISVKTPDGWVARQYATRPGLAYFHGDGLSLPHVYAAAEEAVAFVREKRRPAFLHMTCVRLMGHAGSDVELTYRSAQEIEAVEAHDPLIRSAEFLVAQGWASPDEILELTGDLKERIEAASQEAASRPKLVTAAAVMAPLAPCDGPRVAAEAARPADAGERLRVFGGPGKLPEAGIRPRHFAVLLNWALHDLMAKYPEMLLFGEDVAKKGGVYHVTKDLWSNFGAGRVFNTLLDEQTILGIALGAAQLGFLPCPEIQYLAYLVHASDQLRGEACSLQYFSNGAFANPMVVRVAGLGYQKGFGGHFHNDSGFGFLREMPSLVVACPSRGDDAVLMLRTLFALAKSAGRVAVFLEPIALYMAKDLYAEDDEAWLFRYPPEGEAAPLGSPRVYECEGRADLAIFTFGNGVPMSLRVARRLEAEGKRCRVVDLRWLMPLPADAILEQAARAGRFLVVDEGRESGGIGEAILALLAEQGPPGLRLGRVASKDCFVPLAKAADLILLSEAEIESRARELLAEEVR